MAPAWTGAPSGGPGANAPLTPSLVEGAGMPSVNEPAPTLINLPAYALLRGTWATALTANPAEMQMTAQALSRALTPADLPTALSLIERLARHYPRQVRNEREAELYLEDWWADVQDFPDDILASACAQYRRDGANRFMATPGAIRRLAEPILSFRQRLARRAARVVEQQAQ